MSTTVEAEVDVSGNVRLLEQLEVTKTTRAIVTLIDEPAANGEGNGNRILEFLRDPKFKNRRSYSAEEIEAQIEEARNSWE